MNKIAVKIIFASAVIIFLGSIIFCRKSSPVETEPVNHAPFIESITAVPSILKIIGSDTVEKSKIYVTAFDEDSDSLTYTFSTEAGSLDSQRVNEIRYTPPSLPGNYMVECSVSDGEYSTSDSVKLIAYQYEPVKDMVLLTAMFDELYPSGAYYEKLVLVDYYNPSNYIILTDSTFRVTTPKFSRDKSKILFGDMLRYANDAGPQFVLYNISEGTTQLLYEPPISGWEWELYGIKHVWNYENTGFYHTRECAPFTLEQCVFYYEISTQIWEEVYRSRYFRIYPETFINSNTLIVFSNDSLVTGQPPGFYLMDTNGNYLSRVNNPHLLNRNNIGELLQSVHFDWNNELELLAYSEIFQGPQYLGNRISITNLIGTYYKSYTPGDFLEDCFPAWGPDDKTIIFQRGSPLRERIMVLNIETGEVREFVTSETIDNAFSLRFPDY